MTNWVPVVDMAVHQGPTDFKAMRAKGVRGLILRIAHGLTLDTRAEDYYPQAILDGFAPTDIGFYPFLNPKRGSAIDTAEFAVEAIKRITGRPDFLYMLDIENYRDQTPNVGTAPVYGAAFAAYIREHIATVKALSPKSRVIGYTNRAYWNGKVAGTAEQWVGDDALAASLDWIVARYPAYSEAAYARHPLPMDTTGWGEWAFDAAPDGPFPPKGATWKAWQFSAGFNRQGAAYGVSSGDLDLNIVHPDAWAKWTATPLPLPTEDPHPIPVPTPSQGDDMPRFFDNAEQRTMPYGEAAPKTAVFISDLIKRNIGGEEYAAWGSPARVSLSNAALDAIPDAVAGGGGTVDQVARDMAARNADALSDVRMGGERIASAGGH